MTSIPRDMAQSMQDETVLETHNGDPVNVKDWAETTAAAIAGLTSDGATKYRRLPVEISAMQFLGGATSAAALADWVNRREGGELKRVPAREPEVGEQYAAPPTPEHLLLDRFDPVFVGDWLICSTEGKFDTVSPEAFERDYAVANENDLHIVVPGNMTMFELISELRGQQ